MKKADRRIKYFIKLTYNDKHKSVWGRFCYNKAELREFLRVALVDLDEKGGVIEIKRNAAKKGFEA